MCASNKPTHNINSDNKFYLFIQYLVVVACLYFMSLYIRYKPLCGKELQPQLKFDSLWWSACNMFYVDE